jgi:hypothetical protein
MRVVALLLVFLGYGDVAPQIPKPIIIRPCIVTECYIVDGVEFCKKVNRCLLA